MKLSDKDRKLAFEGYKVLRGAVETEKKSRVGSVSRKSISKRSSISGKSIGKRSSVGKVKALSTSKRNAGSNKLADKSGFTIVLNSGRLVFSIGGKKELALPKPVTELFADALEHLSKGENVTLVTSSVSSEQEVSTQQAAQYLHVSRPFVVNLLESGEIPFRKVGTHRRINFEDLRSYKENIDTKRLTTLAELAKQAQELGMGY